jgi:hypothetical protein
MRKRKAVQLRERETDQGQDIHTLQEHIPSSLLPPTRPHLLVVHLTMNSSRLNPLIRFVPALSNHFSIASPAVYNP